jgi:Spy/CpxP family protein refolding chaperone
MKNTSPIRAALLASVLALAGTGAALAQDAAPAPQPPPPPPPPGDNSGGGGGHHGWMSNVLTPDEQALLKKDTEAVFAADPDLKKEGDDLKGQRPGQDASQDDKDAFRAKMKDFHQKVEAAVEKFDSATTPIYAKLDAAMAAHKHGGGGQ